jgi:enolase
MSATTATVISGVEAYEVLDSRGNPTVEVDVTLRGGASGTAIVPSGASTGMHEAHELRDGGSRYGGRGVRNAVENARGPLAAAVQGLDAGNLVEVDDALKAADGTDNLGRLGANAVLGVSMASARAAAAQLDRPLYRYLADASGSETLHMPVPMLNVLNGGAHADNGLAVQEIMIVPAGLPSFREALRAGSEIYHHLKKILKGQGLTTAVGDEGGFAPRVGDEYHAIEAVEDAIGKAGYTAGKDVLLALDVAASEFHDQGGYTWLGAVRTASYLIELYERLVRDHPIYSIEDGLDEGDWDGWATLTQKLGEQVQLVGDDIFVTNVARVERGIQQKVGNAVLIKPNQIGTLSDTFACVRTAYDAGFTAVMSHRSGETEDTTIADLAVALGTGQIKAGAPCRGERTAKYNRLVRIEAALEREYGRPPSFGLPESLRGAVRA